MFRRNVCTLLLVAAGTGGLFAQAPPLPPVGGGNNPPPVNIPAPDPVAPGRKDDLPPRPGELLPPRPGEMNRPGGSTFPTRSAADLELVERVIEARRTYARSLKELHAHYVETNDRARAKQVEEELIAFHRLPMHAYRLDLDVPSAKLQPLYNQPDANKLYQQALTYKGRGVGSDFGDNMRRAEILLQQMLTNYPQSNRISDAAYHLGDIYESKAFKQYERAAAYYERCFQWDSKTPHDARIRAARIYERDLKDYGKAIELYRMVREYETDSAQIQEANRRLSEMNARR